MFSLISKYLNLILLIITVASGIYGFINKLQKDKLNDEILSLKTELEVKTTETIKYKNKLGQEVTKTYEYSKKITELKYSNDSIEQKLYQTIAASELKERQLQSALNIELKAENTSKYDSVIFVYDTISKIEPKKANEIRYFNDNYLSLVSYPDSLKYSYNENISVITANRLIDRKFFLWRWIGWKKKSDSKLVEIVSDNPNSSLNGRLIKIE